MKIWARLGFGLLVLVAISILSGVRAADAVDDGKDALPIKTFAFGPFDLSAGISDSRLRLSLTGGYDHDFITKRTCADGMTETHEVLCRWDTLQVSLNLDGAWLTGANAHNYGIVTIHPAFMQQFISRAADRKPPIDDWHIKNCSQQDPNDMPIECYQRPATKTPYVGYAVYPDLEYRNGKIDDGGKTYQANQLIYGVGAKLLYPAQIDDIFATTPYVSATYDEVHTHGQNDLPSPSGIKDHFLTIDGQIELYVPWSHKLFRSNFDAIARVKLSGSHPVNAHGWQVARTYEVILQIGNALKPVVTYKSGSDKGLSYDRQILVGVLYSFFNPKLPRADAADGVKP